MAKRKLDSRTIDFPKEILHDLYIVQRLTIKQIAEKLGCSVTPIWRSLKRHHITLKPSGGQYTYTDKGIIRKDLKHLYVDQKMTMGELKKRYKCNYATIRRALIHFDIPIRTQSESNKLSAQKRVWEGEIKEGRHGHNWKGGITKHTDGYIKEYAPKHSRACNGYVSQHILVWEKTYGKPLPKGWHVHHLNGIKNDNRPENLMALPHGEHVGLARPYKKRIRELEAELKELQQLKLTVARG